MANRCLLAEGALCQKYFELAFKRDANRSWEACLAIATSCYFTEWPDNTLESRAVFDALWKTIGWVYLNNVELQADLCLMQLTH